VSIDGARPPGSSPSRSDLGRWRRHLANERAEAAVYRDLAQRYDGEEREILLAIAAALLPAIAAYRTDVSKWLQGPG
jgi:hypothetical protein